MKILWLSTRLMYPLDNGGKIRTYHLLRHLSHRHKITIVSLAEQSVTNSDLWAVQQICDSLITIRLRKSARYSPRFFTELCKNLFSPLPYSISRYRSERMACAIHNEIGSGDHDLIVCDFLPPSINMDLSQSSIPRILFQHNQEATIWRRLCERESSPIRKHYFRLQWKRMQQYEHRICNSFDHIICVSESDRDLLRRDYGVSNLSVVPTGVDTSYFRPDFTAEEPAHLIFTGAMDWMPNQDAILFFAESILPRIRAQVPSVRVTVVGHQPPPRIVALAKNDRHFVVTGRVPDVRPYVAKASVYIVPLRVGGGTRLKIFEAMAMGKATVSTPIGAEGLPAHHGENILMSADPAEFAKLTLRAIGDQALRRRLGVAARKMVEENFDWKQVADQFAGICVAVAQPMVTAAGRLNS